MKKHIAGIVRKDLSRAKNYAGLSFDEYYENIFHTFYNSKFMISKDELKSIINKDEYIISSFSPHLILSLKQEYYESREYKENEEDLYNFNYVKNLFKEENNTLVLLIYKLTMDFEKTTYNEISKAISTINPSIKIDKKQTSHYFKVLKKANLILKSKKLVKNNERVVFKNETSNFYNKVEIEESLSDEDEFSDDKPFMTNYEQLKKVDFIHQNFYKNSLCPLNIMKISEEEGKYLTNPIKFNKSFLEHRFSFTIDETNLENNLFFHLLLNRETGLTMHEICSLLGFIGRDKAIVRFLNNLEKKTYIKRSSIRKGKKFEYIYKLDVTKTPVPDFIKLYVKYYQNKMVEGKKNQEHIHLIPPKKEDGWENIENTNNTKNTKNTIITENKTRPKVLDRPIKEYEYEGTNNQYLGLTHGNINSTLSGFLKNENFDKTSADKGPDLELDNFDIDAILSSYSNNIKEEDFETEKTGKSLNTLKIETCETNKTNKRNKTNKTYKTCDSNFICKKNNITPTPVSNNLNNINNPPSSSILQENYSDHGNLHIILNDYDLNFIVDQIISHDKYSTLKQKYSNTFELYKLNNSCIDNESRLNIVIDFFYANIKNLKMRTFDNINLNRFLYCLNKVKERKIITMNNLRQFILNELEKDIKFTIDRKTLRNALLNLEILGFIKTMEFEIVMKNKNYTYSNNKEEIVQKKLVVMRRDINLTPEMVTDIEELIKPRQKTVKTTDLELIELEIDENVLDPILGLSLNSFNTEANIEEIKSEINNFVSKVDLSINYKEEATNRIVNVLEKYKKYDLKNLYSLLFVKMKRLYFNKNNLDYLYSEVRRKKNLKENLKENEKEALYKILENFKSEKVILPHFMMRNFLRNQFFPTRYTENSIPDEKLCENNLYTKQNTSEQNIASLIYNSEEKHDDKISSYCQYDTSLIELIYSQPKNIDWDSSHDQQDQFKPREEFINIKRERYSESEESYYNDNDNDNCNSNHFLNLLEEKEKKFKIKNIYNLEKNYFINKKTFPFYRHVYSRIIDLNSIIQKIYFNPKITVKRLKSMLINKLPASTIFTDFLVYLNKLGILKIQNLNHVFEYQFEHITDEMSLEFEDSVGNFFDI